MSNVWFGNEEAEELTEKEAKALLPDNFLWDNSKFFKVKCPGCSSEMIVKLRIENSSIDITNYEDLDIIVDIIKSFHKN